MRANGQMTRMKWRNQLFCAKDIENGSRTAEEEELQKNEERGKWDEVKMDCQTAILVAQRTMSWEEFRRIRI